MRGWVGIAIVALLGFATLLGWRDFQSWRVLKGASADMLGWLQVNERGLLLGQDAFDTTRYDAIIAKRAECAFLGGTLPARGGVGPRVGHWVQPHRQLDQIATAAMRKQIAAAFSEAAAQNPETLTVGPSKFDPGGEALFVSRPDASKREAADLHQADGSMHVSISAADAATIIEAGWGQAYPLAGRENFPLGYLLIYAPQKDSDLEILARILRAAIGYSGAYQCLNLSAR